MSHTNQAIMILLTRKFKTIETLETNTIVMFKIAQDSLAVLVLESNVYRYWLKKHVADKLFSFACANTISVEYLISVESNSLFYFQLVN